MTMTVDEAMRLGEKLRLLVRHEDWVALDSILDAIDCTAEDGTPEGYRRGMIVGVHAGFLNKAAPQMCERESFVRFIARYQAALDASPILGVRGTRAETVLGIAPLKPVVS